MLASRFTTLVALLSVVSFACAQQGTKDLTQLLESNKNLSEFTTLLTSYGDIYANLSFQSEVTILAPNNDAFNKIPYSSLGPAFEANQSQIVRAVLQYHILPGLHPSGSYNGTFSFDKTWLQNTSYTNVTGGQAVGGVQQAGDVNVFTSGMGTRSTLVTAVCNSPDLLLLTQSTSRAYVPFSGSEIHWRHSSCYRYLPGSTAELHSDGPSVQSHGGWRCCRERVSPVVLLLQNAAIT